MQVIDVSGLGKNLYDDTDTPKNSRIVCNLHILTGRLMLKNETTPHSYVSLLDMVGLLRAGGTGGRIMISVWDVLLIFGCGYICRLAQEVLQK